MTVVIVYFVALVSTLAWTTRSSGAAGVSAPSVNSRAQGHTTRVSAPEFPHGCKSAAKAIRYYKLVTHGWQRQRNEITGSTELAGKVRWPNCRRAVSATEEWVARAAAARLAYWTLYAYHYDWRAWMDAKHQRVAACETGHQGGTGPEGASWTWDSGRYVSAFGIYRDGYNADAHRIGNLGWDETLSRLHRYATPREQMQAADSHRTANGGWSGWGCRGA
jgi:hypothetical protein